MIPGQKVMIDDLTLLKLLGKGSYGEVFLTSKQGRSELFATKKMDRKYADQPNVSKYLKNEVSLLRELNHVNIVKLEDLKITKKHYYLVMEYCNGGTLSECLKKYQQMYGVPFSEEIVQYLMKQIINGIRYIHNQNIIHRDLKLDNILVKFNSEIDKNSLNMMKAIVKIIDFGFATRMASDLCYSALGSPINMDPIILKKMTEQKKGINYGKMVGYDQKADIWSLGTLCYEMLIGKSAFNSKSMAELVQKVENGSYKIPTHLSKEVVSFLNAMLQYNAQKRLSANELARHHFLTKNVKTFSPIDLRKVSNKIQRNNLNINIKKNNTIWSIFNEEDEKKLINIPINYLAPISEEEEFNQSPNTNKGNTNYYSNDNFKNFLQDNTNQYNNQYNNNQYNNNEQFQGYGVGYDGINAYENSYSKGGGYGYYNYQMQQPQISPNNYNINNNQMIFGSPQSIPAIGNVEPEPQDNIYKLRGPKAGPVLELPSFGVPSPDEDPNSESSYDFSSGIFQSN